MKPGNALQISLRPLAASPGAPEGAARPSRLLTAIYRDIGMAAVAHGLDLAPEALEPAAYEAVKKLEANLSGMPSGDDATKASRTFHASTRQLEQIASKIADTLTEMEQDLQSSISYAGGRQLADLRRANYVILGGDNAGEHLLM